MNVRIVLSSLGPWLVGSVLLFAGLTKALDPENFVRHLRELRPTQRRWLIPAALASIYLQWFLGAALIVALWPRWVVPATILFVLVLTVVGYWGTATGRTKDCGCYNQVLTFSPLQSFFLDLTYLVLLMVSWWYGPVRESLGGWKPVVVPSFAMMGGLLAYAALHYEEKHKRPLFDLSPLKPGRRWRSGWLGGEAVNSLAKGEKIVVFLGATCPLCKKWAKVLNVVHELGELPDVVGAVVFPQEEEGKLASYVEGAAIRFPVVTVKPWVLTRLARGFTPTAVIMKDGVIREKWVGDMPKSFKDRIRFAMAGARASVVADPIHSYAQGDVGSGSGSA